MRRMAQEGELSLAQPARFEHAILGDASKDAGIDDPAGRGADGCLRALSGVQFGMIVRYPGKARGIDFADNDPMTADAVNRVAGFFQARLNMA
ncbi:hypothetical protein [Bradyrhizobium acaciae]|uniref:hypothetical protein n=1 Tax=Bradyrhizobium acaciae TaxID=2683706 RepID=UPI001E4B10F8|nr:hypothetical protein [Bradyrhizobium acaciae]MCC8980909.1 hypothetical protein [Bradyrhizobium acaciae]